MVELFYVREVTAQYSLANFHDVFVFLKHIGPNYTFRDARRILINVIGLISVLCSVISFGFREVLSLIIPPFIREENQFLQAELYGHNSTMNCRRVYHWRGFYESASHVANGGKFGDIHICPVVWLSCAVSYIPLSHPLHLFSLCFVRV